MGKRIDHSKRFGVVMPSRSCGDFEIIDHVGKSKYRVRFLLTGTEVETAYVDILRGAVRDMHYPNTFGKYCNDLGRVVRTVVQKGESFVEYTDPYYSKWWAMLNRCSGKTVKKTHPSYDNCSVDSRWWKATGFEQWVDSQPNRSWENCHLDKDLLIQGNKVYSPETCVFLTPELNVFLTEGSLRRGQYLIGVTYHKRDKVFEAKCSNPFHDNKETDRYLGRFTSELEAHLAWKVKKYEYACKYASMQEDPRVAEALLQRYSLDKDWTNK